MTRHQNASEPPRLYVDLHTNSTINGKNRFSMRFGALSMDKLHVIMGFLVVYSRIFLHLRNNTFVAVGGSWIILVHAVVLLLCKEMNSILNIATDSIDLVSAISI